MVQADAPLEQQGEAAALPGAPKQDRAAVGPSSRAAAAAALAQAALTQQAAETETRRFAGKDVEVGHCRSLICRQCMSGQGSSPWCPADLQAHWSDAACM